MEGLTSPAKEVSTGSGSTIHPTAGKWNSANFTLMELGIFARVPPEYPVRGFTEGERKPRAVPSLYRALALLCRLWANFAITEFSEVDTHAATTQLYNQCCPTVSLAFVPSAIQMP